MGACESAARVGRVGDHPGMQLAQIAPLALSASTPVPAESRIAAGSVPVRATFSPVASPAAPAAIEAAVDGAARVALPPVYDFPGIKAGDVFDIVKGSKVGFLGVKGVATITRFEDDGASFAIKAGAFGVKVDVVVDVQRTGADTVRISSRGTGIPDTVADGRVVESRTNYAEFERTDETNERTVIEHDGEGGIVIDTVVPTFGDAHLILERR